MDLYINPMLYIYDTETTNFTTMLIGEMGLVH